MWKFVFGLRKTTSRTATTTTLTHKHLQGKKQDSSGSYIKNASTGHGVQCSSGIHDEGIFKNITICPWYFASSTRGKKFKLPVEWMRGIVLLFWQLFCTFCTSSYIQLNCFCLIPMIFEARFTILCSLLLLFMFRLTYHIAMLKIKCPLSGSYKLFL